MVARTLCFPEMVSMTVKSGITITTTRPRTGGARMTSSTDTVLGVFENESQARHVVEELVQSGFTRDQVHISSENDHAGEIASGGASLHGRTPEHHGGGFMHWLESLF